MEQELSPEKLLEIIADNFLCVRRLPFKEITLSLYKEGDEGRMPKPTSLSDGSILNYEQTIIFSEKWNRKLIKSVKKVASGGWWYVKPTENTSSIVRFNREHDKFFASTLEGAVKLFLESKK